jgi:phosphoribosylanthranilate isomerase
MIQMKVCGMKYPDNIEALLALEPDYMGLIFWEPSTRFAALPLPKLEWKNTRKVGVFVDASLDEIHSKIEEYELEVVQLHGQESPDFVFQVNNIGVKVIKSFNIDNEFNFKTLENFKTQCDYFLFDSKSTLPGGSGTSFNWEVLKNYDMEKPYFLSGGLDLDKIESLQDFLQSPAGRYCHAVDVNSRFELAPGLKDISKIKLFQEKLNTL